MQSTFILYKTKPHFESGGDMDGSVEDGANELFNVSSGPDAEFDTMVDDPCRQCLSEWD